MEEFLRSLIPALPNLQVLIVGNSKSLKNVEVVGNYLDEFGGMGNFVSYEKIDADFTNVELIDTVKEGDRIEFPTRGYEALIILDVFEEMKDKKSFLRAYYHSLENSGNCFILVDKEKLSFWDAKDVIEEANFVAVNEIDLDERYYLISCKKMHGWGGGM